MPHPAAEAGDPEMSKFSMLVKLRYKEPEGDVSRKLSRGVEDDPTAADRPSDEFRFAAAVAAFGMILRESPNKGHATLGGVLELAGSSLGDDPSGYRKEFLDLVRKAQALGTN